ncbi:RNA polymerase sigma factor [Kiloniella litopenaei]|uniref:RNA polymerase sigma factor n=1 Tax=Kiloniella litopenaei TaxID=1549748 RepID=UPI003BAB7810
MQIQLDTTTVTGPKQLNFEQKLESSMPKLKRYARYLTKDDELASDLFQETYGRAHAKQHLYDDAYEMEQWLFPIMKNLWINQIKRRQKELQSQTEIENDSIQNNICFAKEIEHRSLLNRVQDVLKNLPQKDQEVLEQIVSFGHSYEEAAEKPFRANRYRDEPLVTRTKTPERETTAWRRVYLYVHSPRVLRTGGYRQFR